jgi:hypothetical protein
MKIRFSVAIALLALLVMPGMLFAQSTPAKATAPAISVTLEYFENNSGVFDIKDDKGASVSSPQIGDELKVGWTVITGKGDVAELKMTHSSTIIKLSQNTNFKLEKLRADNGGQDVFSLAVGKIRTVAGKASTKDQYQIKTQSAVCGVRGSDVVIEYGQDQAGAPFSKLSTLEGTGWIQNAAGDALDVAQGFFADALASTFKTFQIPPDVLDSLTKEMNFTKLDPNETLAINKAYQASLQPPANPPAQQSATPPAPATNSFMDGIMSKLKDILGMEIGSVSIGGITYSKVVVSPTFQFGDLKMALYLPVIYQGDMFNPSDWYHPMGNDEWSFGTDAKYKTDTWGMVGDIASDLFLKIKYVEWGRQRDPFFFKVGNLNDVTIGHGLIMRDFSNDADFPAVRRVGVNVGLDFGGFGLEAMVNDAASPDIFGGRLYIRPVPGFKAALGFSALIDLNPAKDWPTGAASAGDPIFINPGVDLDIPFVESDFISIVAFADGATMIPYFRSAYGSLQGFDINAIFPNGTSNLANIKNWGVASGLFGNLIIRDFTWRLEFRDYTGAFIPEFYGSGYERQRTEYLSTVLAYLSDPTNSRYDTQTMGVFGEGGIALSKLFSLKLSYFWPWAQNAAGNFTFDNDHFVATFTLEKGVIPVVNIWGTVSYERSNLVPTFLQNSSQTLSLFDANTIVSATISYPVSEMLDVTLLYTTTAHRDSSGNVVYSSSNALLPQMDTSLAIETQVHL